MPPEEKLLRVGIVLATLHDDRQRPAWFLAFDPQADAELHTPGALGCSAPATRKFTSNAGTQSALILDFNS